MKQHVMKKIEFSVYKEYLESQDYNMTGQVLF